MSYEFKSDDGIHFIKDFNIYNGLTLEKLEYRKQSHRIKLYYYKRYQNIDGFISVDKEYDYFDFNNLDEAIKIYSDLKKLLENKQSNKQ